MNKTFASTLVVLMMLVGCKENNPPIGPSEEEVITTVTLTLTESGTSNVSVFVWEDIDGVGGNAPNRIDTIRVAFGNTYAGTITIENRSVTPPENITTEIYNLSNQHQFFFTPTNGIAVVAPTDFDDSGLPVGLKFSIAPVARGAGTLTVALSHYAVRTDKDGITPSSETDISVTFPFIVE